MIIKKTLFGEEAKAIRDKEQFTESGQYTEYHTKIQVTYRSIEGHPTIELELEV